MHLAQPYPGLKLSRERANSSAGLFINLSELLSFSIITRRQCLRELIDYNFVVSSTDHLADNKTNTSLNTFKKHLKTHLFQSSYTRCRYDTIRYDRGVYRGLES